MSILLFGGTGQVGWELLRTLAPLGLVWAPGRAEADLARPETLRPLIQQAAPRLIVNAAAYTAVDKAESEEVLAGLINGTAPGVMAEEARRLGVPLIHYSTDYVFDGSGDRPYREEDPVQPVNAYGRTKLAGEQAIADSGAPHLIFRTSWVYGARGTNFLRTMLRLAREREALKIVNDQVGAPTPARLIAEATAQAAGALLARSPAIDLTAQGGVYHLTSAGACSWFDFAQAIFADDPQRAQHTLRSVEGIATADYPTPARRPANSRLDCTRLREALGLQLPDWRLGLGLVLEELRG